MMKEKLTVIKVGGKIVEEEATLNQLLADSQRLKDIKCWYMAVVVQLPSWLLNWVLKARW